MKQINKLYLGTILVCALLVSACAGSAATTTHNSRNSLDWAGTYVGLIPSAGGMGIEVRLTLSADNTYELLYHYVERENPNHTSTGNFTWNSAGSIISLDISGGPHLYQVGENMLRQLDLQGRVITGDLADMYILRKI